MTFFTSDPQYNHLGALISFSRPFKTLCEMDEFLIYAWNQRVREDDTVYIVGDCSTHDVHRTKEILKRLKGNKALLWGNHDDALRAQPDLKEYFFATGYMLELEYNGQPICLCHYPMIEWQANAKTGGLFVDMFTTGNMVLRLIISCNTPGS